MFVNLLVYRSYYNYTTAYHTLNNSEKDDFSKVEKIYFLLMSDCVDSDDAITKVRMLEPRPPPAWSSQDTVDQAAQAQGWSLQQCHTCHSDQV